MSSRDPFCLARAQVLLSEFTGEKVDYNNEKHVFMDANTVRARQHETAALPNAP